MEKIIYIMDPHCGWCYGNSANIVALESEFNANYEFELLVGGMWTGANAPVGSAGFGDFISKNSPAMEKTTGANVGKPFYELTKDGSYTFSSLEPCCAIVLVKEIEFKKTILFAKEVQKAIFLAGKRLDKAETYVPILENLNIDSTAFEAGWMTEDNLTKTQLEFSRASHLANGFPTLVLDHNGTQQVLAAGFFNYEKISNELKRNGHGA